MKWISVKERLPEDDGEYIVATKYGHIFIFDWLMGRFFAEDRNGLVYEEITHWMPLPKPPKEK
jgi:hypothetical protein